MKSWKFKLKLYSFLQIHRKSFNPHYFVGAYSIHEFFLLTWFNFILAFALSFIGFIITIYFNIAVIEPLLWIVLPLASIVTRVTLQFVSPLTLKSRVPHPEHIEYRYPQPFLPARSPHIRFFGGPSPVHQVPESR